MSESDPSQLGEARSWLERVVDLFTGEPADRRQLIHILRATARRNILSTNELNIILGALHVADMQARDILIPPAQVVTVRIDQDPAEILPVIISSRHSRFPVIGDDMDDVRGILHAKDLLALAGGDKNTVFAIKDCIRPATVVPESKRLDVLLQDFRENRNHMAVVVDEYGNTAGIVTIEDVLEQIVGDIEDEYDVDEEHYIKQVDDRMFTIKALTPIEDFNERFDTQFSDDEFDTIGGIVASRFGHLPEPDESIEIEGFHFRVLNADSRRIRLLELTTPEDLSG